MWSAIAALMLPCTLSHVHDVLLEYSQVVGLLDANLKWQLLASTCKPPTLMSLMKHCSQGRTHLRPSGAVVAGRAQPSGCGQTLRQGQQKFAGMEHENGSTLVSVRVIWALLACRNGCLCWTSSEPKENSKFVNMKHTEQCMQNYAFHIARMS